MNNQNIVSETNLPNPLFRGKVRDTYDIGDGLLLMVATDRISAFDVVLPTPVPQKGEVLSRLSAFWFSKTENILGNHLVALADDTSTLNRILGYNFDGSLSTDIAVRSSVVRKAERVDVECVIRGYLAGSAWEEYQKYATIHGEPAPKGMIEGDKLPNPIFTPTTKADQGHDLPLSIPELVAQIGKSLADDLENHAISLYSAAHDFAFAQGLILADTKLEFGLINGNLILIDEAFTPDSSRFWDVSSYQPGETQTGFDKQFVRDWLTEQGWDREPPGPELPLEIIEKTRQRYFEAYRRLTNEKITER
jgi:phosphoribosylaminoimidazole-succinocarboxamide synthase